MADMTFAALRRRNLLRAQLSTDRGAEQVTFYPAGGKSRPIIASIHNAKGMLSQGTNESISIEEIDVRVCNDLAAEDGGILYGGIENPSQGDCLVRANETEKQSYSFAFKIRSSPDSWLLRFKRQRREQVGMKNTILSRG